MQPVASMVALRHLDMVLLSGHSDLPLCCPPILSYGQPVPYQRYNLCCTFEKSYGLVVRVHIGQVTIFRTRSHETLPAWGQYQFSWPPKVPHLQVLLFTSFNANKFKKRWQKSGSSFLVSMGSDTFLIKVKWSDRAFLRTLGLFPPESHLPINLLPIQQQQKRISVPWLTQSEFCWLLQAGVYMVLQLIFSVSLKKEKNSWHSPNRTNECLNLAINIFKNYLKFWYMYSFCVVMSGIEPRASHIEGMCTTTEPHPWL